MNIYDNKNYGLTIINSELIHKNKKNTVIFAISLLLLPTIGETREWYAKPFAGLETTYDTNTRMREDNRAKDTFGVLATVGSDFGVISDRMDMKLKARFKSNNYEGDDLNSNDFYLNLYSNFKVTEKNIFSFDAQYIEDTSLTSEEFTSGFVQSNTPRQQYQLTPKWTYQFSETQFFQAFYAHSDTSYDKKQNLGLGLFDYHTDSIALAYSQQWNEVFNFYVSLNALDYNVPEINRETRDYSATVGGDYHFSETWMSSFSLGGRRTETIIRFNGNKLTDVGYGPLFSLRTEKIFEKGLVNASFSQSLDPTGTGKFLQTLNFLFNSEYRLTERLKALFLARITNTSSSIEDIRNQDRTYYIIEPKLSWQLNRQTDLSGSYRFRYRKYDFSDVTATSNAVFLNLNYRWDKFSTRRF